MDDKAEDWQKWERIKAEKEKASRDSHQESKGNLAYIDPATFTTRKGFTKDPAAFLASGEKSANAGILLGILGLVGEKMFLYLQYSVATANRSSTTLAQNEAALRAIGLVHSIFNTVSLAAPIFAIAAIASAVYYYYKTKKKVLHILISAGITIGIFLLNQWLTTVIINMFQSR